MKKLLMAASAVIAFLPYTVSAHGIGQVYALPVPLKYYLLGAGLAVAFSFFIIALFLNKSSDQNWQDKIVSTPWLAKIVSMFRAIAVFLLILSVATGIIGSQDSTKNFTPVFFWIYFILGIGILSLFVGNLWDKINPWKTITAWVGLEPRDRQVSGLVGTVLLLSIFWLELVSGESFVPRVLGMVLAIYTLVNLVMSQLYRNWYKDGEVFSVLFDFIGKLAHCRIGDDNKSLVIVNESKKLEGSPAPWWTLGIATILLAGASFDSLKETVMWFKWLDALGFSLNSQLGPTIGIILAPLPFLLTYLLSIWVMKLLVGKQYQTLNLARRFVWSLIPIAFGYTLAHNFSLTIVTAPQMLALISDPFGFGWNLFGTASFSRTNLLLGANMVWFIEIGFIILAHVVGVLYAHVLAVNIFKDPKLALKSQYPLVILMVGFTVMTLWLLSQPLVVSKEQVKQMQKEVEWQQTVREPPMPPPPVNK